MTKIGRYEDIADVTKLFSPELTRFALMLFAIGYNYDAFIRLEFHDQINRARVVGQLSPDEFISAIRELHEHFSNADFLMEMGVGNLLGALEAFRAGDISLEGKFKASKRDDELRSAITCLRRAGILQVDGQTDPDLYPRLKVPVSMGYLVGKHPPFSGPPSRNMSAADRLEVENLQRATMEKVIEAIRSEDFYEIGFEHRPRAQSPAVGS